MKHDATGWDGEGRMVFALFSDKRVFTRERVPRPRDIEPIYGTAHGHFRAKYPAIGATHRDPEPIHNSPPQSTKRKKKSGASRAAKKRRLMKEEAQLRAEEEEAGVESDSFVD